MSERNAYPPGVLCWVAAVVPEPDEAVGFYRELFGWEAENLMAPDSPARHFVFRLRGHDVAAAVSQDGASPAPVPMWATYISVESADDTARRVSDAGGSLVGDPFDSPCGARVAVLSDSSGAVFCAWEPGERPGARLVNEPGAWSMSQLNTADPEGAKAFYGTVFGWDTDTFDLGETEITLWRVPGYVGGEPEQPVARDVVGTMVPMSGGRQDNPPAHWSVDFWVDDVDAVVERAFHRGGRVVMPPVDSPIGTTAFLADPQGAAFSVSKVGPAA
jgi:predicted enzyme related to lactoylglutathione lyase